GLSAPLLQPRRRQPAVQFGQAFVPLRVQCLFDAAAGGVVPAQRGGAFGIGGDDRRRAAQRGRQRVPAVRQRVGVGGLLQRLRGRQRLLLAQRAEQAVGLLAAARGRQRFRAQGEAARRQRLRARRVQRVQRLGGRVARQRLFGPQQRLHGGMAFAEGGEVAAC